MANSLSSLWDSNRLATHVAQACAYWPVNIFNEIVVISGVFLAPRASTGAPFPEQLRGKAMDHLPPNGKSEKAKKWFRNAAGNNLYDRGNIRAWVKSSIIENVSEHLKNLPDHAMLFFIDEIGDPGLTDDQPYFCLSCAAIWKSDYQKVTQNWERLMVTGRRQPGITNALHAKSIFRRVKGNLDFIEFCNTSPFFRFSCAMEDLMRIGITKSMDGTTAAVCLRSMLHDILFWMTSRKNPISIERAFFYFEHSDAWSGAVATEMGVTTMVGKDVSYGFHYKCRETGPEIPDFVNYVIGERLWTRGNPIKTRGSFRALFGNPDIGRFHRVMGMSKQGGHPVGYPLNWND